MKKITYHYENLPSLTFVIELEEDADIERVAEENKIVIDKVEEE